MRQNSVVARWVPLAALALVGCGSGGGTAVDPGSPLIRTQSSSAIVLSLALDTLVAPLEDQDQVAVMDVATEPSLLVAKVPVGDQPTSVALDDARGLVYVTNHGDDTVSVLDLSSRTVVDTFTGIGTGPYAGALSPSGDLLYVATTSSNDVVKVRTSDGAVLQRIGVGPVLGGLRAIAITDDGDDVDDDERAYVPWFLATRRSGAAGGEGLDTGKEGRIAVIELNGLAGSDVLGSPISLPPFDSTFVADARPFCVSNGAANDTFCGSETQPVFAFPNLLHSLVIVGSQAYLPSIASSPAPPVRFDANVFSVVNRVRLSDGTVFAPTNLSDAVRDEPVAPATFANGVFPSTPWAAAANSDGTRLFVVSAGSDYVMRLDRGADGVLSPSTDAAGGLVRFRTGKNPQGIVLNAAGTRAYVLNGVSRDVSVIDLQSAGGDDTISLLPPPIDPVEVAFLRGKELFNSSLGPTAAGTTVDGRTPRFAMSDNGWGSCFNCHPFGLADGVTWSFSSGPRQTGDLSSTFDKSDPSDQRILNWTAISSSLDDFEKNTENVSGGFGLIGPNGPGDGVVDHGDNSFTEDWSAIETYVKTIRPPRAPGGLVPAAVASGRVHFESLGCATCHGGPKWSSPRVDYSLPASGDPDVTISDGQIVSVAGRPVLRNVGTFDPTGPLEVRGAGPNAGNVAQGSDGFNPPSLFGLGLGRPLFHDGRFANLPSLLSTNHGTGGFLLNSTQILELTAFLKSIDTNTATVPIPP
jgi:YVTN family beta-propeller protein